MKHWERICIRDRAGSQKIWGEGDGLKTTSGGFGITQGENTLLFQTEENKIGYKIFYNFSGGKVCLWSPLTALILGIKLEAMSSLLA